MATGDRILTGVPASGGRAAGPLHVAEEAGQRAAASSADPLQAMRDAAKRAAAELERLAERSRAEAPQAADVLEAQALMLRDPAIEDAVREALAGGADLREAVPAAFEAYARQLDELGDEYLAARAGDVREASRLLLAALTGGAAFRLDALREPAIVVAHELSPADTLAVDRRLLLGIVTEAGGPTSHAAIVARELGVPAVLGVPGAVAAARGAAAAEVDGGAGTVRLLTAVPATTVRAGGRRLELAGLPVRLMANAGSGAAVATAAERGARGIGLFRTELLFLGRPAPMPEDEQAAVYAAAAAAMAGHPVVVRTLDAGSDKALSWLAPAEAEPNPALGVRGIRLWLRHPDLAAAQVRALLRAGTEHPNLQVMLPMVAAAGEVGEARALFEAEAARMGAPLPRVGIMIETPAAAADVGAFAGLIDFVSLGTNDLTQYALGADRELRWGPDLDESNPGVRRLIELAVAGARGLGVPVGVCGEMAGSPEGALFLAGLGVDSLSMSVDALERVAAALRG